MAISNEQNLKNWAIYNQFKNTNNCKYSGVYCCAEWKKYFLTFKETNDFSPKIKLSKTEYFLREIINTNN